MKQKVTYRDGYGLAYAEYGDTHGYPILVQHGLIASIDDYELFDRLIRLNARVVCVARPGYGESSPYVMASFAEWADIVAPLISALGLGPFDLLGMSSGAPYSYALGWRYPDRVRNLYIFSGLPALYDHVVRARWPYPLNPDATLAEMEELAQRLFFSNLSASDRAKDDMIDSMRRHGFGVAQDLRLRARPWGFTLAAVPQKVYMRHSQTDESVPFDAAARTAQLLPHCELEPMTAGPHFSVEALDDFIQHTVAPRLPAWSCN